MERKLLNAPLESEVNTTFAEFAELVLNKALCDFRKEQLRKEIDKSLEARNKEEFLRLTEELKNLS
jgi:uncharacterized protein YpiB (UPF0302 family)